MGALCLVRALPVRALAFGAAVARALARAARLKVAARLLGLAAPGPRALPQQRAVLHALLVVVPLQLGARRWIMQVECDALESDSKIIIQNKMRKKTKNASYINA